MARLAAATVALEGSHAFGRSALALWDLTDHPSAPIVVVERQRRIHGVRVVVRSWAMVFSTTRRRGIPTVTLDVALASIAATDSSAVRRQVISERTDAEALPLSDWSRDFADRIIAVDGRLVAQVDLAFPDRRHAIELDSVEFHFDLESFESDRRRDVEIANEGWLVDR